MSEELETAMSELSANLSEETMVSPQVAKRIIDRLSDRGISPEMFGSVLWEIKCKIKEQAIAEKLNKTSDEEIGAAIDEIIGE